MTDHVEVLKAIRSAFDGIPSPCAERDAMDAAIAAMEGREGDVGEADEGARQLIDAFCFGMEYEELEQWGIDAAETLRLFLSRPVAPEGMVVEGWRGIESAPRDGAVVDLWASSMGLASRDSDELRPYVSFRVSDACWWQGEWRNPDGNSLDLDGFTNIVFTHWMPLPAAPSSEARS